MTTMINTRKQRMEEQQQMTHPDHGNPLLKLFIQRLKVCGIKQKHFRDVDVVSDYSQLQW